MLAFIAVTITACSAGSKTLYKNNKQVTLQRIGFAKFMNSDSISRLYPPTAMIFKQSVTKELNKVKIKDIEFLDEEFPINNPDSISLLKICTDNKLDAIILSQVHFFNIRQYLNPLPVGSYYDTEITLELFDKNAAQVMTVSYNTAKGKSYLLKSNPTVNLTLKDGVTGAIKKLLSDLGVN